MKARDVAKVVLKCAQKNDDTSIKLNDAKFILQGMAGGIEEYAVVNLFIKGKTITIKPSKSYNADAKPRGIATKITDNMDDTTKRSLIRENEAAETLAKNGNVISIYP